MLASCHLFGPLEILHLHLADQALVDFDDEVGQEGNNFSSLGVPAKLAERVSDRVLLARGRLLAAHFDLAEVRGDARDTVADPGESVEPAG